MFYDYTEFVFKDVKNIPEAFKGTKKGNVYFTRYQFHFSVQRKDAIQSFMMPLYLIKDCKIKQPVFGVNYSKRIVKAEKQEVAGKTSLYESTFTPRGTIELHNRCYR